jgi:hypothetical protein
MGHVFETPNLSQPLNNDLLSKVPTSLSVVAVKVELIKTVVRYMVESFKADTFEEGVRRPNFTLGS